MMNKLADILLKDSFNLEDVVIMLSATGIDQQQLFDKAEQVRLQYVGNGVYGRALIELTNYCKKDCFYCGIRKSNKNIERYILPLDQVKSAVDLAIDSGIGSIAIQSGELSSPEFTNYVLEILEYIKSKNDSLGVTLSCGEQSIETYQKWFDAGAERYLLRIEVSDEQSYYKYHPNNKLHSFHNRLKCLKTIKEIGFQTGTGVMIGLPDQTIESLAKDVIFMRDFDIDMCGMGPFIPCNGTPMEFANSPFSNILETSLKMIAVMRIVMKNINIVASTAMETIDPMGRTLALKYGANVLMPNINPAEHRKKYKLYEKIPTAIIDNSKAIIEAARKPIPSGYELITYKKGNAPHFNNSKK